MAGVADSLAGRAGIIELETLSLREITDALPATTVPSALLRGGFPELHANPDIDTAAFYSVDFVIDATGRVELFEAKWTELPTRSDAVNLTVVRRAIGPREVSAAAIACRARNRYPLGDDLDAITIADLLPSPTQKPLPEWFSQPLRNTTPGVVSRTAETARFRRRRSRIRAGSARKPAAELVAASMHQARACPDAATTVPPVSSSTS